jgi:hypothetical protein
MMNSARYTDAYVADFVESDPYTGRLGELKTISLPFWTPNLQYFVPHPTDDSAVLVVAGTPECEHSPNSPNCRYGTWFSNDFGSHWALVLDYVAGNVDWAVKVGGSKYKIIADDYEDKSYQPSRPVGSKRLVAVDLARLISEGLHAPVPAIQVLMRDTYGSVLNRGILFLTKPREGTNPILGDISLFTSHDGGHTFKHARLPTQTGATERGYTIMDVSSGAVTVNVLFRRTNWGNVYTSDGNGDNYALNLRYASRSDTNQADFATVRGIEGIFLANVEITPSVSGSDLATRISYDRGGEWFPLAAPDSEKSSCTNPQKCHLHLNAQSSTTRQPFFSRTKAIGVVIGTGNVGDKLSRSGFKTFLSRDAGKTWKTILQGANHFEISQNGGIILAARKDQPTDRISWSTSDGQSWNECLLPVLGSKRSNQPMSVVEPERDWTSRTAFLESMGPTFLKTSDDSDDVSNSDQVYVGDKRESAIAAVNAIISVPSQDASARFLVHIGSGSFAYLDFNNTESRSCIGWDDPRVPNSDYEVWSPSDLDGDGCLLGAKIVYARKKPDARCWISHATTPEILHSIHCQCFRQDYMCDYCFAPNITDPTVCELDCPDYNPDTPPADCQGTWVRSKGYRLVANDRCRDGVDLRGIVEACPPSAPRIPTSAPVTHVPPVSTNPPTTHNPTEGHPAPQQITPPVAAPTANKHKPVIVAVVASFWALVVIAGIIGTLTFLSTRNAQIRHSLMKCIPDTWLPAYVPPDREEGPQYHRLQGTSLNTDNDDIFNDDEFLQEDANVLEIDD